MTSGNIRNEEKAVFKKQPVYLMEYTTYAPQKYISKIDMNSRLANMRKNYAEKYQAEITEPVNQKWVYVFRLSTHSKKKNANTAILEREVWVNSSGASQTYEPVSWKRPVDPKDDRRESLPRPTKAPRNTLSIDVGIDYILVLSQIQIPFMRIKHYLNKSNLELLRQRGVNLLSAECQADPGKPMPVYLIDFQSLAGTLHKEYIDALKRHIDFLHDETDIGKRYMAEAIWAIAQSNTEFKNSIRFDEKDDPNDNVSDFRESQKKKIGELLHSSDAACDRLCSWISTPGYRETRSDHNGSVEIEKKIQADESKLLESIDLSGVGLNYLEKMAFDRGSWYSRYLLDEAPFNFWYESVSQSEEFAEILLKYMEGRILGLIRKKKFSKAPGSGKAGKIMADRLNRILKKRKIKLFELDQIEGNVYVKDALTSATYKFQTKNSLELLIIHDPKAPQKVANLKVWSQKVNSLGNMASKVLAVMAMYNYASAMAVLENSSGEGWQKQIPAGISAAGATFDAVGSSKIVFEKVFEKGFQRLAIMGTICDYLSSTASVADYSWKEKYRLMTAYGVQAAGYTGLLAGTLLGAKGVAFTFAAGTWFIIGAVLVGAGWLAVWALTPDPPFLEWAEACYWGKSKKADKSSSHLNDQIARLHEILAQFQAECHIRAKVKPGLVQGQGETEFMGYRLRLFLGWFEPANSFFKVDLRITNPKEDKIIVDEKGLVLRPQGKGCTFLTDSETGRVTRIDRTWSKSELGLGDDFWQRKVDYVISAQLDFSGDGRNLYPPHGPFVVKGSINYSEVHGTPDYSDLQPTDTKVKGAVYDM